MKKFIFVSLLVILMIIAVPKVWASTKQVGVKSEGEAQVQNQIQTESQTSVDENDGYQLTVQNETQTENQAEENQVQVSPAYQPQLVVEKATEVNSLLGTSSGYGRDLQQELANYQGRQSLIQSSYEKLESRVGWQRRVLGPDYRVLKKLNDLGEEIQLQIRTLKNYQEQVSNQAEQTSLRELIRALEVENTSLQQRVEQEEARPGVFGWLLKLLVI